jgi:hypothetical protein
MMKKIFAYTLTAFACAAFFSVSAFAQATHSLWTNNNGFYIRDAQTTCTYSGFTTFEAATSWTEPTPGYSAGAHFRGISKTVAIGGCVANKYEFALTRLASTTADEIRGLWRVTRNGAIVCNNCNGTAYGLSQAAGVGNYYKVYVDDPTFGPQTWLYSGFIDVRKDF